MTTEKAKTLLLAPIVGGIFLVGGIVFLVVGKKKKLMGGKTFQSWRLLWRTKEKRTKKNLMHS